MLGRATNCYVSILCQSDVLSTARATVPLPSLTVGSVITSERQNPKPRFWVYPFGHVPRSPILPQGQGKRWLIIPTCLVLVSFQPCNGLYRLRSTHHHTLSPKPLLSGNIFFSLPATFFLLLSITLSTFFFPMPSNLFSSTLLLTSPSFK